LARRRCAFNISGSRARPHDTDLVRGMEEEPSPPYVVLAIPRDTLSAINGRRTGELARNGHPEGRLRPPTRAVPRPFKAESAGRRAAMNGRRTGGVGPEGPQDRPPAIHGRDRSPPARRSPAIHGRDCPHALVKPPKGERVAARPGEGGPSPLTPLHRGGVPGPETNGFDVKSL
jgi:hypothetical protein